MAGAGRPSGLTPKLIEQFVHLLEGGALFEMACDLLCIPMRTFTYWRKMGADELDAQAAGEAAREDRELHVELLLATTRARSHAHNDALKRIIDAGKDGNVQADQWFLERTAPQKFGRQTRQLVDLEVKEGTRLVFNLPKPDGWDDADG
jgi:hypothetical protein